jgi:hypothetical protein
MAGNEHDARKPGPQHEQTDVDVWAIGRFVIALIAVVAVCMVLLFGAFHYLQTNSGGVPKVANEHVNPGKLPPNPRLEIAPVQELQQIRDAEQKALDSYGWVDRKNGVVRIPVSRAIDLLAQRGLPSRASAPASVETGVSIPAESGLGPKMLPPGGPLSGDSK